MYKMKRGSIPIVGFLKWTLFGPDDPEIIRDDDVLLKADLMIGKNSIFPWLVKRLVQRLNYEMYFSVIKMRYVFVHKGDVNKHLYEAYKFTYKTGEEL